MRSVVILMILISGKAYCQKEMSWAEVKKNGKGKVDFFYCATPGFNLVIDKNGTPDGLAKVIINDFISFIKSKYGVVIEPRYSSEKDFYTFLEKVKNSNHFVGISNTSINADRKKYLKFTYPYISSPVVFFSHVKTPDVSTMHDMVDKNILTVNVEAQTSFVPIIEEIKRTKVNKINITQVEYQDLFTVAVKNPNSLTLISMLELISAFRGKLPLKVQSMSLDIVDEYSFVFPIKTDWDIPWKEFMNEDYINSSHYREAVSKYLGTSFLNTMMKLKKKT